MSPNFPKESFMQDYWTTGLMQRSLTKQQLLNDDDFFHQKNYVNSDMTCGGSGSSYHIPTVEGSISNNGLDLTGAHHHHHLN